jgi:hypothetical protein
LPRLKVPKEGEEGEREKVDLLLQQLQRTICKNPAKRLLLRQYMGISRWKQYF